MGIGIGMQSSGAEGIWQPTCIWEFGGEDRCRVIDLLFASDCTQEIRIFKERTTPGCPEAMEKGDGRECDMQISGTPT